MKPELLKDAIEQSPKSSYDYEVFACATAKDVEQKLNENKDRIGFYWYFIPQNTGCYIVIATANLEVIQARTKPRIELGLQPLKEHEAKTINIGKFVGAEEEVIHTWITLLYEQGYEVAKRVQKEVKE